MEFFKQFMLKSNTFHFYSVANYANGEVKEPTAGSHCTATHQWLKNLPPVLTGGMRQTRLTNPVTLFVIAEEFRWKL